MHGVPAEWRVRPCDFVVQMPVRGEWVEAEMPEPIDQPLDSEIWERGEGGEENANGVQQSEQELLGGEQQKKQVEQQGAGELPQPDSTSARRELQPAEDHGQGAGQAQGYHWGAHSWKEVAVRANGPQLTNIYLSILFIPLQSLKSS